MTYNWLPCFSLLDRKSARKFLSHMLNKNVGRALSFILSPRRLFLPHNEKISLSLFSLHLHLLLHVSFLSHAMEEIPSRLNHVLLFPRPFPIFFSFFSPSGRLSLLSTLFSLFFFVFVSTSIFSPSLFSLPGVSLANYLSLSLSSLLTLSLFSFSCVSSREESREKRREHFY